MMRDDDPLRDDVPNRYFDPHFKVETAKILPGEYYATNKDMALVTVLGSCVSACLRDRENGIGGMNHFMLPDEGKLVGSHGNISAGGRYGVHAMELLINQILKLGGKRERLEAKVFGGSLPNCTFGNDKNHMGQLNVQATLRFLQERGIRVVQSEVGGTRGRKLVFQTDDGRAWSEQL